MPVSIQVADGLLVDVEGSPSPAPGTKSAQAARAPGSARGRTERGDALEPARLLHGFDLEPIESLRAKLGKPGRAAPASD